MVFEGRIADMLQNQASRFLRGFTAEQIRVGLLKGRLELQGLALNPEPLDVLFMESEIPLVMKAGLLSSAVAQVSILQGELELTIDGLLLVLCPACRWLARDEVYAHRLNEIQRLEFVHMRSQCQRRTLEHEMFRQLFQDYLSRLKITVKNVHVRLEAEGELFGSDGRIGASAVVGMVLNSCTVTPLKSTVQAAAEEREKANQAAAQNQQTPPTTAGGELLLAERVTVKGLSLYHEMPETARLHVSWATYHATKDEPLGAFHQLKQDQFVRLMAASRKRHCDAPALQQLMPNTSFAIALDLKSTLVRDGFHVDSCLVMEIAVKLEGTPSRLHFSDGMVEHLQWFISRTLDFQLWQFLHPTMPAVGRSAYRGRSRAQALWGIVRRLVALRRRIHSNTYSLEEAITMRVHCKEYVRLYKKKFNGPASVVGWRRGMPALTNEDAARLSHIELLYPADKLVNFRLMAHAELKTEMALNNFLNADDFSGNELAEDDQGQFRRIARELTPLEQLHLHGQHGYGVNIYRGLPPPPSSLKIRIEIQAPDGLWWVCQFGKSSSSKQVGTSVDTSGWVVAVDCVAQPLRVLLVDSVVDTSVFTTIEVPPAPPNERPLALLLGRTASAFDAGSPARGGRLPVSCGGTGDKEWLSLLEMDGHVCMCGQLKTLLTSSPNSPWDIFLHLSCGDPVDTSVHHSTKGRIPAVGVPPGAIAPGQGPASVGSNGRLRACLPLRMPSGQPGPLASMLRRSILLASSSRPAKGSAGKSTQISSGPAHSAIAWMARLVCGTRDIAMLRVNVRLPQLSMQVPSSRGDLVNHMQLPRFDGAVHLEHGGLVDGFVVGLHSLRHFASSIIAPPAQPDRHPGSPMAARSASTLSNASIAWPLWPLEQAPPLSIISAALSLAFSVVVAGQTEASDRPLDAKLVSLLRSSQLIDVVPMDANADLDPPAAAVTLVLVVVAVMIGRRLIWDVRDSRQVSSSRDPNIETAEARAASAAVTEVHRMAGGMMRVLLLMGFPLHSRCMPIAAWGGALEIIQATALSLDNNGRSKTTFAQLRHGLGLWAARGAFSNLQSRQDEVIRYLLKQGMKVDEIDKAGRSLLDWACWGGCEGLTALALRAGLLSMRGNWNSDGVPVEAPRSSPRLPPLTQQSPFPLPPSALTLAVASRCPSVVSMLLRAGGDPHVPPRGGSCGALYLAVRNCEFELGLQVLHGSPFVSVEVALGAPLTAQGAANGSSAVMKGDGEGVHSLGCKVRATVTLIDSIRRFAASLPRRSTEDVAPLGASSGLRAHPPGPHPDEGIFAPTHIPFVDILHPVMEQFPQPIHKVSYDMQVRTPPLAWLRRKSDDAWEPVYRFIECCLQRGFSPDAAVVSRALPALSAEACRAVQHMMFSSSGGSLLSQGLLADADGGSTAHWFGAVIANTLEREEPEDLRGRGAHQDVAVVSCAKELRDIRQAHGVNGEDTNGLTRRGEPWHFAGVQARPLAERGEFSDIGSDPLLTALAKEPPPGKAEAAKAAAAYLQSGPWQVPASASTVQDAPPADVPQVVRVVVVGAPRVGKTRVAAGLLAELAESKTPESDHVWLKMSKGVWPAKGRALAEVHLWDTSAATQPGILPWLADAGVPCMLVVVLDAANPGHGAPAEELLTTCVEKACEGSGCIRVLAVDNIFPGYAASTGGRETLEHKRTPSGTPVCAAIRCNLASSEGTATLRKAFTTSLAELVRDAEVTFPVITSNGRSSDSKGGKIPSSPFGIVMEPCSSTSLLGASDLGKDRRLLGSRLRGDSAFADPSAVSWAWAAVCAAQGYLLEGSNNVGSALVLWERLEHVLSIADSRQRAQADQRQDVAHILLSALTNMGLVCPIPSVSRSGKALPANTLGCTWVLIPDFARRLHLTSGMAARIRGASSSSSASTAASSGSGSPPISARLVWNQGAVPSLRAALRDFMGKGVLGGGNARFPSRSLEAHRFALLEAGPTGKAMPGESAGLEPGFLLTFDFTQASSPDSAHEDAPVSPRGMGACAPKPPASVTAMSPSGLVQDSARDASQSNATRLLEDDFALLTGINGSLQRLTVVAVGTSNTDDKAFWDVHCSGPHAQWAMRALLGEGNAGHGVANSTFVALSRAAGTKVSAAVAAQGKTEHGWPLPPPPCVVSASASERGHLAERPTAQEFFGLGWLFNGPQAAPVRESLVPQQEPQIESGGGLAACCAVLCGKRVEKAAELPLGLEDDGGIAGLASCADFEASLLARSWKMAPRFLDEALASSAEAWAICSASLLRVAHDSAAAVGGERGRALPLLHGDTGGSGGAKVIGLVPEGPIPLLVPAGQAKSPGVLGEVRSCAGVEAWLRLCKPAALWSAAGYARGYTAVANELQATVAGSVGVQVVEALRSALSVRFTEQMILEVWDALIESGASQNLVRRAGGSWTQANGSMLLL